MNVTSGFHLKNCNYFSMYVFLPFWSLLQLSQVDSSLPRAEGRWDNSDSSELSSRASPRLRQKVPQGPDRRVTGISLPKAGELPLRQVLNTLMFSGYPYPVLAHKSTEQMERRRLTSREDLTHV